MKNNQWKSKDPKGAATPKGSNATALEAIASVHGYTDQTSHHKQKPKRPAALDPVQAAYRRSSSIEPRASLRMAIDKKCRDCGATDGGAHWRLHVAACPVTDCPLWSVRPLPKPAPDWLTTRVPDDLPIGWRALTLEGAIAAIKAIGTPVTRLPGASVAGRAPMGHFGADVATSPCNGVAGGVEL